MDAQEAHSARLALFYERVFGTAKATRLGEDRMRQFAAQHVHESNRNRFLENMRNARGHVRVGRAQVFSALHGATYCKVVGTDLPSENAALSWWTEEQGRDGQYRSKRLCGQKAPQTVHAVLREHSRNASSYPASSDTPGPDKWAMAPRSLATRSSATRRRGSPMWRVFAPMM